jgi:sulfur-carrier protein
MKITLRYFASVRETVGISQEQIELPAEVLTVGQVRQFLAGRGAVWADALSEGRSLRMACGQTMCGAEVALTDGCEVAFFPPVTGG